jgi:hypothetical protein
MIAAIYARKSTEQNGVADEAKSVTRQIDHARAYAIRKGWIVASAWCCQTSVDSLVHLPSRRSREIKVEPHCVWSRTVWGSRQL